ncbi:autotransporter domain-containing protein [Campylobacter gastrosuis]|uniref:Autotransporter domain-containing protein n=1 Tax=Campylobacter gastrosuis TaxID=2974576 RepID=A0ABT7HMF7_9BACT|nr:autotransporter domain-containing protein [Campylobacter gastrosuis]MDL0088117.1 autotransporter domain-containing protein [Campylobacter gastrosuis]
MKISRVVCATLFGVSLSVSSTFGYSVDEKLDEINKNLKAYNDFYLPLQDKSADMAQKLGKIESDIKNVTTNDLNTGGKYEVLGDMFKFVLDNYAKTGLKVGIGSYDDENPDLYKDDGRDTGGWTSIAKALTFTAENGRNVSISYYDNIQIKFDNGEQNIISLGQDGKLYASSSSSGDTIFQSGLSKNDLAKIASLVENSVKNSVDMFKVQTLVDGLTTFIADKDESEYKDNAKFLAMFNEIKKLGNSDDVLKSVDLFYEATARKLELIKDSISKLNEIKNISGDKSAKVKEFNEFLVKNNFSLGVDKLYSIDGYVNKAATDISDDDLDKILNVLKAEQKNYEEDIKFGKDYMASNDMKAMLDKFFNLQPPRYSVSQKLDEIEKNLKAYNDFYLRLQDNSANIAQELGKINGDIKNVTSDELNTGGKYEVLGDMFKFVLDNYAKAGLEGSIGSYDELDDPTDIESGGWVSIAKALTFTTEDGRNVNISSSGGRIFIKIDNSEGNLIELSKDGKLVANTYGEGSNAQTNTIFKSGLSKNDLVKLAGLVESSIKGSVDGFKNRILDYGLLDLAVEKDESEYKDNAKFKAILEDIKKLGDSQDILNALKSNTQRDKKYLELIKETISKLNEIKNISGDKSAKLKELDKFLVENNFSFGVHNKYLIDGYVSKAATGISDDDLNEILAVLEKEQQNYETYVKDSDEALADEQKYKSLLDKILSGTTTTDPVTPQEQAKAETEAINSANEAVSKTNGIKSEVAEAQNNLAQAKLDVIKINADPTATTEQKEQALAKQTELENLVKEKQTALNEAKQAQNKAIEKKIEAITNNSANKLEQTEKSVALALASIVSKDDVAELLLGDKDSIISAVKDAVNSVKTASETLNSKVGTDIIKFSADIATNTRLAKLSNPFNDDLALAYAISNLKGEAFADGGDSLSSVVRGYTNRFSHDNSLWATLVGSKSSVKNGVDSKLYGFNIGYDKTFDNTIVGSYLTYAKTKANNSIINNEADNYQFGVYSRSFIQNSEIDAKLSFGVGKNELKRIQNQSEQTGKYDTKFLAAELTYGYIFDLGSEIYAKPLAGVAYTYASSKAFDESGTFAIKWGKNTQKSLSLKAGVELRKYVADGSYLYITPAYEQEIYKKNNDLRLNYVGSDYDIIIGSGEKKHGYAVIQTGADFAITPNLSTNINFGAKARSGEKYYNGTLGLRYKF